MKRFFIVELDAVDYTGHFFNQVFGLRDAALELGLEPHVFVPTTAEAAVVKGLDAKAILPRLAWFESNRDLVLESFAEIKQDLTALWQAIAAHDITEQDILFFTSSRPTTIFALGDWLSHQRMESRPATFVRFIGAEISNPQTLVHGQKAWAFRFASDCLATSGADARVFFTVNNRKLLKYLEILCGRRAFFLPVPKYYDVTGDSSRRGGPPTIYVHLNHSSVPTAAELVNGMARRILQTHGDVKLLVKLSGRYSEGDFAPTQLDGANMKLLPKNMDAASYFDSIKRSDIVLLPYNPVEYRTRASGPYCEAVALGKVVVAPDRTWMSEQIADGQGVGILFDEPSAETMADAVIKALRGLPRLREDAACCADAFRAENSTRRHIELMLELAGQANDMRPAFISPKAFTLENPTRRYFRAGWSEFEPDLGVWTDGPVAELVFRLRPAPEPQTLKLLVRAFLAQSSPERRVEVRVNGQRLTEWTFHMARPPGNDWCWCELKIPASAVACGQFSVALHFDQAPSPFELEISSDRRRLGLMLRELIVTRGDDEP